MCVDGQHSDVLTVTLGVPQGSILDTLLFTLYLNDLPNVIITCMLLTTDLERNINEDLIKEYIAINKLFLNIHKCAFLTIGTQQRLTTFKYVNIKIDEIDIVKVTTSKYLGFVIDQTLRLEHHIESMVKKLSSEIDVL